MLKGENFKTKQGRGTENEVSSLDTEGRHWIPILKKKSKG